MNVNYGCHKYHICALVELMHSFIFLRITSLEIFVWIPCVYALHVQLTEGPSELNT